MTSQDGGTAPRRRRGGAIVLGLVVVLSAAVVLTELVGDDRPRSEPGDLVEVSLAGRGLAGYAGEVVVPDRRLTVVVTEPTTEPTTVPDDDPVDDGPEPLPIRPPEDGSFVGVEVTAADLAAAPSNVEPVLPLVDRVPAELTLVVSDAATGERRYPLPDVERRDAGRAWVAVVGEPSLADVTVDVSYDQVIQVVDPARRSVDRGLAEPLYDIPGGALRTSCGPVRIAGGLRSRGSVGCSVTLQRTAYLPGEGWSDEGEWLVATTALDPPLVLERTDAPGRRYLVDDDEAARATTVLLDGAEPDVVTDTGFGEDDPVVAAWDLADDPAGSLLVTRLDLPVSSEADDPRAIDDVRVVWRRTVRPTE